MIPQNALGWCHDFQTQAIGCYTNEPKSSSGRGGDQIYTGKPWSRHRTKLTACPPRPLAPSPTNLSPLLWWWDDFQEIFQERHPGCTCDISGKWGLNSWKWWFSPGFSIQNGSKGRYRWLGVEVQHCDPTSVQGKTFGHIDLGFHIFPVYFKKPSQWLNVIYKSPSLGTGRATGCDCCGIGLRIRDGTPNICSQQVQGHPWLLTQLARRDGCAKNHRVALHLRVLPSLARLEFHHGMKKIQIIWEFI